MWKIRESVKPFFLSVKAAGHSGFESFSNTHYSFIQFRGIISAIMDG